MVRVLGGDVAADRAGLVQDEAVIVDVWHLAEWLLGQVLGRFVLARSKINGVEVERDLLLAKNNGDPLGAGGDGGAIELENHVEQKGGV